MPKDSYVDVVFAGTKGQPLPDMSLTVAIRRMNGDDKPVWADANGGGACAGSPVSDAVGMPPVPPNVHP